MRSSWPIIALASAILLLISMAVWFIGPQGLATVLIPEKAPVQDRKARATTHKRLVVRRPVGLAARVHQPLPERPTSHADDVYAALEEEYGEGEIPVQLVLNLAISRVAPLTLDCLRAHRISPDAVEVELVYELDEDGLVEVELISDKGVTDQAGDCLADVLWDQVAWPRNLPPHLRDGESTMRIQLLAQP